MLAAFPPRKSFGFVGSVMELHIRENCITVIYWLIAAATITLVPKIDAATT